jgi:hypothetical protein
VRRPARILQVPEDIRRLSFCREKSVTCDVSIMPNYKFSVTLGVTQPRSARERACGRLQGLPSGRDHARGSTSLEQTRPQAGEPRSPPHFPPIHTLDSWIHQAPVPSARAPTRFDDPTGAHGYDGWSSSL